MRRERIYLDTSVFNFLFADDAPDFRRVTEDFFSKHSKQYDLFIGTPVLTEIARTPDPSHRERLQHAIRQYAVARLSDEPQAEIETLAQAYVAAGVVPVSKYDDET
ncbi:MAG: hypothetical protein HY343_12615 [Lentisphaerae bacterium]|nr:hypothetical protein [Lentisphaerota bacterium]